ncbi:hypothetical protein QBC32DRAFT_367556 [Pseudoneurospora amorphoporcata]|uniref:(4-O-methyl)-D-glucuronate--lignin esterase n=1 Tax=Pseudoneurospora amorphoporcata TaxID=241081 RepID=A0AAN6SIL0_9PEZI|nr:hypothetical protein QBC32DRAFT_367556 [Pseudoneurospora amorphoporcata]
MRATTCFLAGAAVAGSALATPLVGSRQADTCAPIPSPFPTWQQLPTQSSLPDPLLPRKYTTTDNVKDILVRKGRNRIQTPEQWYKCRQPEIMQLLQEYQYGYYPDHSQEKVEATRSGNTVNMAVTAGGKTAKFKATISLPSGASASRKAPVAWGFYRTLDALNMTVPEMDASRVGVTGCSRLGKGTLAAGLFDKRITVTMPMSSGVKSGAGWWTSSKLGTFVNHALNLPYDAHTIAAAITPKALIIDQGTGDASTDSKATAMVVYPAAKAIYDWLGVGDKIGINVRGRGHCDMSGFSSVLPFVQKVFFGTRTTKDYNNLGGYGSPMSTAFPWSTAVPRQ